MNQKMTPQMPVLITGSSRGIGQAIAEKFALMGHPVILNCKTDLEALLALQKKIETSFEVPCLALPGDVSDPDFVASMYQQAEEQLGGISILINNAGISHIGLLSDMTPDQWNQLIAVNLSSAFYCSRQVIPAMVRRQQGKILNISSVWGVCGASCEAAYSASKGGLNALTRALGKELAPSNIQVNAIACGVIDTHMNQCFSDEERIALADEIPAGIFGQPADVATLAYDLCTTTSYLTGQVISLDGGWI